jgi:hypothetical protein
LNRRCEGGSSESLTTSKSVIVTSSGTSKNIVRTGSYRWKLGNLCFKGTVPARAITKVVLFEPKKNPAMAADSLNPTITLANYKFCGERYRAVTRWFMGEDIDPATVSFGVQLPPDVIGQFSYATEAMEAAGKILQNRRGLKVIFQLKSLPVVSSV